MLGLAVETVTEPCWIEGVIARVVKLPDGSGRIEAWAEGVGWVPSKGVSLADFFEATPLTPEEVASLNSD